MVEKFFIKKGDTLPYYKIIIRDDNGAMDLTGATVLFTMQNLSTGINKIESQSAVLAADIVGGVEYQWEVGDTDTPAEYGIEFEVTTADGVFTVPSGFAAKVVVEDTYDE